MATQGVLIDEKHQPIVEDDAETKAALALINKAVELKLGAPEIAQLWAVQKDIKATAAKAAYDEAFGLFKRNPPKLKKTKRVYFKSKDPNKPPTDYWHAELDKVCEALIPALSAVGITHRYEIEPKEGMIYVTCILTHEMGHSERTTLFGLPDDTGGKNKIQAVGSSVTYLERYTLLAATGLATEGQDNDGATAGGTLDHVDEREEEILTAPALPSLMQRFKANHEAAVEANDAVALLRFNKAKDKRKEELENAK